MARRHDDVRDWNTLLADGIPLLAIYLERGAWQTGRIQRVRRRNALVWSVQPWGVAEWRELKTYRHIWRDCSEDAGEEKEKGATDVS